MLTFMDFLWLLCIFVIIIINVSVGCVIGVFRGRAVEGGLLGFLLGPIGWFWTWYLIDLRPCCPDCLKPIKPESIFCPYCSIFIPTEKSKLREPEKVPGKTIVIIIGAFVAAFGLLTLLLGNLGPAAILYFVFFCSMTIVLVYFLRQSKRTTNN